MRRTDGATEPEPNPIGSYLSRAVTWEGCQLTIGIYRPDDRPGWTLEVVDEAATAIVWDDLFDTDRDADTTFRDTLAQNRIKAVLEGSNVIPFSGRRH